MPTSRELARRPDASFEPLSSFLRKEAIMVSATFGPTGVDWEARLDVDRLRRERLQKLKAELDRSDLGALLTFDFHNIRYMTSTHIGTWAIDKMIRFALLPRGGDPVLWDFGSAARHHQLQAPWLDEPHDAQGRGPHYGARAGISTLRGAISPDAGRAQDVAAKVARVMAEFGLTGQPIGVDVIEPPVLFALRDLGFDVVDGQQVFLEARRIKTRDEIGLLTHAVAMVDAAYEDLYEFLRPGVRENECVGLVTKKLFDLGSEHVEGANAISDGRSSPHPHVFSDRLIRPGDPAFFDILHSYQGYRTCYYRTFAVGSASRAQHGAYKICRELMDNAIDLVKPGATTAEIVQVWPEAPQFGFANEEDAFALQYGHGVGLSIWERPIFSRLTSIEHPETLEVGQVFALETYWPAEDGWGAARIEEELLVTESGCEVITKFPAEELLVAGKRYFTTGGALPTMRDSQSHLNTRPTGGQV
jgi:Xaa-Pro aminopeptidase